MTTLYRRLILVVGLEMLTRLDTAFARHYSITDVLLSITGAWLVAIMLVRD